MATNNAYTVYLTANSTAADEQGLINGSMANYEPSAVNNASPTWVLTFVRFQNRDTFRNEDIDPLTTSTTDPLVVENDCVSVTTTENKGTLTPGMEATLKETDVNYLTAVAPGDFVFVNMLNWEVDARRVALHAKNGIPINGTNDGFKGIYKVQSVRKSIVVNEQTGEKVVFFKIDGYAFTEFNNTIYFNPNLLASGSSENYANFIRRLSHDWINLVSVDGYQSLRDIIALLISSFVGTGVNTSDLDGISQYLPSANTQFYVPSLVGKLLNIPQAVAAKDIYNYIFGIQSYSTNSNQSLAQGFSPKFRSSLKGAGMHYTPTDVEGKTFFAPEYWNCNKAWAIINQYANAPLNEIYTCHRIGNDGHVYPTMIFRQMPFTTQDFESRFDVSPVTTKFLTLPRWKLDSSMVFSLDIGRDEAARTNYYQYFSRGGVTDKNGAGPAQEIAAINYVFDSGDVKRSGLRPSIIFNLFDPFVETQPKTPTWSKIMADATFGSHLKLNGTIEMLGVVQPIAIGDNLEFEGTVFHIETVIHTCSMDLGTGIKKFRTILKLSSGVSLSSSKDLTLYSEMTNTNGYQDRQNDYNKRDEILPGISESQDVMGRPNSIDITSLDNQLNNLFPEPTDPNEG